MIVWKFLIISLATLVFCECLITAASITSDDKEESSTSSTNINPKNTHNKKGKKGKPQVRRTIRMREVQPLVETETTPEAAVQPQTIDLSNVGSSNKIDVNPNISVNNPAEVQQGGLPDRAVDEPETENRLQIVPYGEPEQPVARQPLRILGDNQSNQQLQPSNNSNNSELSLEHANSNQQKRSLTNSNNIDEIHLDGVGNKKVTRITNAGNTEHVEVAGSSNTQQRHLLPVAVAQPELAQQEQWRRLWEQHQQWQQQQRQRQREQREQHQQHQQQRQWEQQQQQQRQWQPPLVQINMAERAPSLLEQPAPTAFGWPHAGAMYPFAPGAPQAPVLHAVRQQVPEVPQLNTNRQFVYQTMQPNVGQTPWAGMMQAHVPHVPELAWTWVPQVVVPMVAPEIVQLPSEVGCADERDKISAMERAQREYQRHIAALESQVKSLRMDVKRLERAKALPAQPVTVVHRHEPAKFVDKEPKPAKESESPNVIVVQQPVTTSTKAPSTSTEETEWRMVQVPKRTNND